MEAAPPPNNSARKAAPPNRGRDEDQARAARSRIDRYTWSTLPPPLTPNPNPNQESAANSDAELVPMPEDDDLVGYSDDEGGEGGSKVSPNQASRTPDDEERGDGKDDGNGGDDGDDGDEKGSDDGTDRQEDDEGEDMMMALEKEVNEDGDSKMKVEYNRQHYYVPNAGIKRDYGMAMEVPSAEVLGEMVASQASAGKWPLAATIDPAAVVVLEGKFKPTDKDTSYAWYTRLVVKGEPNGDDKDILRHIPKQTTKEFIKMMSEDGQLCSSRLITDYQPSDYNQRVLVPLKDVSDWTIVPQAELPKSLAVKPAGQGGKTKVHAAARDGEGGGSGENHPSKRAAKPKGASTGAPKKPAADKPTTGTKAPNSKQSTLVNKPGEAARKPPASAAEAPTKPAASAAKGAGVAPAKECMVGLSDRAPNPDQQSDGQPPTGDIVHRTDAPTCIAPTRIASGCVERFMDNEEQTVVHTYRGTNESTDPGNTEWVIREIKIPAACSSYLVKVEYTVPARNAGNA